jgi:hypothetical protein
MSHKYISPLRSSLLGHGLIHESCMIRTTQRLSGNKAVTLKAGRSRTVAALGFQRK